MCCIYSEKAGYKVMLARVHLEQKLVEKLISFYI